MSALSRRQALAGMSAATAIAVIPVKAVASVPADRTAWNMALRELEQANAASDAFGLRVDRIDAAFERLSAKVPHVAIKGSEAYYGRPLSTADTHQLRFRRASAKQVRYVEACAYDGHKWETQLIDAADARDAKIQRISDRLGRGKAHSHYERLSEQICAAEKRLLDMPAPDGEALLWKVDKLWDPEDDLWSEDYTQQTHVDLRRLLSGRKAS